MNKQQMKGLLDVIANKVYGDGEYGANGCAPVELRIGFVNNIVVHDGIVITNAPPVVTTEVMNWIESQDDSPSVTAAPGFGGLLVRL
jgi:hypothetical protein